MRVIDRYSPASSPAELAIVCDVQLVCAGLEAATHRTSCRLHPRLEVDTHNAACRSRGGFETATGVMEA